MRSQEAAVSRSERVVLALGLAVLLPACAQIAGMQDVVVVDDATSVKDDTKGKSPDGGASSSGGSGASGGAPSSAQDGGAAADAGTLQCITPQPTCDDPDMQGNAGKGLPCFDSCTCAKGLWCGPQTTNYYGPGVGECCARGPCGGTCATDCDCASGKCSNGICK